MEVVVEAVRMLPATFLLKPVDFGGDASSTRWRRLGW
jgi:hypothetical protein